MASTVEWCQQRKTGCKGPRREEAKHRKPDSIGLLWHSQKLLTQGSGDIRILLNTVDFLEELFCNEFATAAELN